jgi:hypothetical protein
MLGKLVKAGIGVALLPVGVAADVLTLGGTCTNSDKSATEKILVDVVAGNIAGACDDLDKLTTPKD